MRRDGDRAFEQPKLQEHPSSSQASNSQSSDEEVKQQNEKNDAAANKDLSSHEGAAPTGGASQPSASQEQTVKKSNSKSMHSQIVLQTQDEKVIEENTILMPYYKPGYQILYGDQNFYLWFKQFATIYERLYKAKSLIADKIDDDFNHDERLKGHEEKKKQMTDELFNQFVAGLVGNLHQAPDQKLDQNKYEDFVRSLMGSNAYLLFVFDKLILATVKLLIKFSNNEESQKSLELFGTFNKKTQSQTGDIDQLNERSYLAHFQASMQQLSGSNFTGKGVRLLFSPLSKIMTIHMFNLNPYPSTDKKPTLPNNNTGQQQNQAQQSPGIMGFNEIYSNQYAENNNKSGTSDEVLINKVKDLDRYPPIFLNRNRRKMKEVRKNLYNEIVEIKDEQENQADGETMIENGLVFRMVPLMNRMHFDADTEDVLLYKRKTALAIEDEFKWSLIARDKFEKITKRRFGENQERLNIYTNGGVKQDKNDLKQSSGSSNDGQKCQISLKFQSIQMICEKSSPSKINEEGSSPQPNSNQMQIDSEKEQSPVEQDHAQQNNEVAEKVDKQMSDETGNAQI